MTIKIFVLTDAEGYVVQESRLWWEPGIEFELPPDMIELDYDPRTITTSRRPNTDSVYEIDPNRTKVVRFNVITKTWDTLYV